MMERNMIKGIYLELRTGFSGDGVATPLLLMKK